MYESAALPRTIATEASAHGESFWRTHLLLPLCCFFPVAALLAYTDIDRRLSRAWAFDTATGGFPARHAFWAERVLHNYGDGFVWLVVLATALVLALAMFRSEFMRARRPALYVLLAIGLSTALIGGLKHVTQVRCPWELQGFGGTAQYVPLFAAREAQSTPGMCFPGAHSGSGFALFALYFALRSFSARWARWGLFVGLLTGCSFAFGQEARGAHFLSHDLWSAMLAWCMCLTVYVRLLSPASLRGSVPRPAAVARPVVHPAPPPPAALP